ncbi:MAG: oxygen-dependent coproporphyrinogen oxidase [Bacteroidia bacterium]
MALNKEELSDWLKSLQKNICNQLESLEPNTKFESTAWERTEGGGGISNVIRNGKVFEKGGVMFSAVHGNAPEFLLTEKDHAIIRSGQSKPTFFATGVSIVIHPLNPFVPIIHMNIRYFEMSNGVKWIGGGIDLTPHYIKEEDATFFHSRLKNVCDKHHPSYYAEFKKWADDYFYIKHRQETRGIGGIFFDRLNESKEMTFEQNIAFWKDVGEAFAPTYLELVKRNMNTAFNESHKEWQLIRRGRYVEFNLVYDKGTKFGLETNGRIESILMSLPKYASWEYDYQVNPNSIEAKTLSLLKKDIDWVSENQ